MSSDFKSTNLSVLSPTGSPLSESLVSSASASTGLSTALSGDVVLPLANPTSGRAVLIDRFPNSVLTWINPSTAEVIHQLPVGTGFASNPQDYLEVSADKAYVTRYGANENPGQEPNDAGSDVLVINAQTFTIDSRVDLSTPTDGSFLPSATRLLRVGDQAWVVLQRFAADFSDAGDARIVGVAVADDSIAWRIDLAGIANCGGVARSPSGHVVALSCTGVGTSRSGVVLLDATATPPHELKRFDIGTMLGATPGSTLAFAGETKVVGVTLGDFMAGKNDTAYALDTEAGTIETLLDGGAPFVLGDVRCAPGCSDICFLADAQANGLRVWKKEGAALTMQALLPVDPNIGLAPRALGGL